MSKTLRVLSDEQEAGQLELYDSKKHDVAYIARQYGVSRGTVYSIVERRDKGASGKAATGEQEQAVPVAGGSPAPWEE